MDFEKFTLAASTADLSDEPAARRHADIVEFRLDLSAVGVDALETYEGDLPLLVTNRATWEGGKAPATADRLAELTKATTFEDVTAIDIELEALDGEREHPVAVDQLLERARTNDVSVVVSTHDFDGTPPRPKLETLLTRASEYGDVAKLAVTADARSDVLSLLTVTHELTKRGTTVATMAMGEPGRHSRAVAPLYGSKIGYAPVSPENATAPGQYDLETLRSLVTQLADGTYS